MQKKRLLTKSTQKLELKKSISKGYPIINTKSSTKLFLKINQKSKKLIIPGYLQDAKIPDYETIKIETIDPIPSTSPYPDQYNDIEQIKNAIFSPSRSSRSNSQRSTYHSKRSFNQASRLSLRSEKLKLDTSESVRDSIEPLFSLSEKLPRESGYSYKRSFSQLEDDREKYINLKQKYEELLENFSFSKKYYEEEIKRLKQEVIYLKSAKAPKEGPN